MPAKPTKSKTPRAKKSPTTKPATPAKARVTKSRTAKTAKPTRDAIFVSYSHADKEWLDRLRVHLKPLERDHKVDVWNDTKLRSGDKWKAEIDKALAKAKVAIMLVSADFLASDFVHNEELPPLLDAAEKEGLIILSILVGHCGFTHSPLSQYQAVNDPAQPINNLTPGQADQIFYQLSNRVRGIFIPASAPVVSPTSKAKSLASGRSAASRVPKNSPQAKSSNVKVAAPKRVTASRTDPAGNSALLVLKTGQWEIVRIKEAKQTSQLELIVSQPTPQQRAFLSTVKQTSNLSSIVYRSQLHLCTLADISINNVGSQETWRLTLTLQGLNRRAEITYVGISPAMQAEALARLLLFDSPIPNQNSTFFGNFNSSTNARFENSPLPTLYKMYNRQSAPFKIAATLICTWYLKINNIVEHILLLNLTMKGDSVTVRFEGERNSQYQNDEQPNIKIDGNCDLSKGVVSSPLQLVSNLPYR